MLENVYASYRSLADEINWKQYDQNELFFNYLKYKDSDKDLAEKFYSAILCRYWGYTGRLYLKCAKNITFEECYDVLIDTINYLLEKQVWNNPESSLYQDPKGPEKAFHLVLKRQLSLIMAKKTADKRKSEFKSLSIDEIHEKYSDSAEGLFNVINTEENSENIILIDYIRSRPISDIIILDKVCFSNWTSFRSIITDLKSLDEDNFNYYANKYNINLEDYNKITADFKTSSNKKIHREIKKVLYLTGKDWKN